MTERIATGLCWNERGLLFVWCLLKSTNDFVKQRACTISWDQMKQGESTICFVFKGHLQLLAQILMKVKNVQEVNNPKSKQNKNTLTLMMKHCPNHFLLCKFNFCMELVKRTTLLEDAHDIKFEHSNASNQISWKRWSLQNCWVVTHQKL